MRSRNLFFFCFLFWGPGSNMRMQADKGRGAVVKIRSAFETVLPVIRVSLVTLVSGKVSSSRGKARGASRCALPTGEAAMIAGGETAGEESVMRIRLHCRRPLRRLEEAAGAQGVSGGAVRPHCRTWGQGDKDFAEAVARLRLQEDYEFVRLALGRQAALPPLSNVLDLHDRVIDLGGRCAGAL